ncbi:MAG: hypothetical protein COA41_17740 [Sphingopyxis sp.]|nr:MAG: hypothetical protein COA41_17740 [Sphingopyxis sp.]
MIRSLLGIIASAMAVAGCAGPIETRVQSQQLVPAVEQKGFAWSPIDPIANRDTELARDLVGKSLVEKGYQQTPDATILVHVALADRPANIAIDAGDDKAVQPLVPAKRQKSFQSCKDREHRLTVSLFDQRRRQKLYSGSAAEYHCKGTIAQSLPFLVNAALSGLDGNISDTPVSRTRTRQGIE